VFILSYQTDDGTTHTRELRSGETIIGRAPSCGIVINHPSVSRQHARVVVGVTGARLTDLGSTFGTSRAGVAVSGEAEIQPGDRITIGRVEVTLTRPAAASQLILSDDRKVLDVSATVRRPVAAAAASRGASADAARLMALLSEIGRTLVTAESPQAIFGRVVDLVFETVAAERVFLLMREAADRGLTPRVIRHHDGRQPETATLSRTVVNTVMRDRVAMLATDAFDDARLDLASSLHELNIRSFMCAPLWNRTEVIGVLYADTPRARQFSESDLDVFTALSNYAAVAIEQARVADRLAEERRRREQLQRYHSPGVVNRILADRAPGTGLLAEIDDASVMFCDIVGFTTQAEGMAPMAVAGMLNEFFAAMTAAIFEHGGTLDKFIGDAILSVFGAPFRRPDHALSAVRAAIGMRKALAALNARHPERPLEMRLAIHSGRLLAGDVGSPERREFTVLGDTVNIASRLQSYVSAPGQIVISKDTYQRVRSEIAASPLGPVTLRGRRTTIDAWLVEP
jgi:adenylate cyclase